MYFWAAIVCTFILPQTYVAFVDSDDWIELTMIEELYKSMTETTDLAICGLQKVDKKNNVIYRTSFKNLTKINCSFWEEEDFYVLLHSYSLFQPVCKLYKLKTIRDENISFNANLNFGEDFMFNINYLNYCENIKITDKVLYNYRSLGQGLSSTFNLTKAFSFSCTKDSLLKFAVSNGVFIGKSKEFIINNTLQDFSSCINQMFNSNMGREEKLDGIRIMKKSRSIESFKSSKEYRDKYRSLFFLIEKDKYFMWYLYSKIKRNISIMSIIKKKLMSINIGKF